MRFIGALWGLLVLAVGGAIAWFTYNAGVQQGLATSGHLAAGQPYPYPYPDAGWGFVPLLFFILFLALVIRGARWRGHRHWGHGYGQWYGGQPGQLPPPIDERLRAWHESAHGNPPAGGTTNP